MSLVALVSALPVLADEPAQFREFTFKKVKPPKAGSKNRINIQIEAADLERQRGKSSSLVQPAAPKLARAQSGERAAPNAKDRRVRVVLGQDFSTHG